VQVCIRETNESEPYEDASLRNKCRRNQGRVIVLGQVRRVPDDWADGDRRRGGVDLKSCFRISGSPSSEDKYPEVAPVFKTRV